MKNLIRFSHKSAHYITLLLLRCLIADGEDITVENNTVFNSGNPITAHRAPTQNFIFRNNIFSYGNYGFVGDDMTGQAVFATYFADGTIVNNLVVNANKAEKQ